MIKNQTGQALITLLVFVTVGIVVTSGAVVLSIINSQSSEKTSQGEDALRIAESGVDNAILRLLRNPNYSGETLAVGPGTATIIVTGTTTKTIISHGVSNNFKRKVQVVGTFSNEVFTISSWSEID